MPWELGVNPLVVVAVVSFVIGVFFGAGLTLGQWLMNKILNRPPAKPQ